MDPEYEEYKGHRIELRRRGAGEMRAGEGDDPLASLPELIIDGELIRYGRLPTGKYFLHENAYEWQDDLMDLAHRFLDRRA